MNVLIACEYSGIVSQAFRDHGHNAWSCDILDTEGDPNYHIKDDVLLHLNDGWDIMIAHPPCTYLCNSGLYHLHTDPWRWLKMYQSCYFFNNLLNAPIPKIAIENPIQHKYARSKIRKPDDIIQPYHFGHTESKATCLWLKNLPPLIRSFSGSDIINHSLHNLPPSPNRSKLRSKTFTGIAKAMAYQWGNVSTLYHAGGEMY